MEAGVNVPQVLFIKRSVAVRGREEEQRRDDETEEEEQTFV